MNIRIAGLAAAAAGVAVYTSKNAIIHAIYLDQARCHLRAVVPPEDVPAVETELRRRYRAYTGAHAIGILGLADRVAIARVLLQDIRTGRWRPTRREETPGTGPGVSPHPITKPQVVPGDPRS